MTICTRRPAFHIRGCLKLIYGLHVFEQQAPDGGARSLTELRRLISGLRPLTSASSRLLTSDFRPHGFPALRPPTPDTGPLIFKGCA